MAGGGRAQIAMNANNFNAMVSVPVWTSQMFINTWQQDGERDFEASLSRNGDDYQVMLNNRKLPSDCTARMFAGGKVYDLNFPGTGTSATESVGIDTGLDISTFVASSSQQFYSAITQRRAALGSDQARFLINPADAAMAISLGSFLQRSPNQQNQYESGFMFPGNLDLSELLERGQALILVYCDNYAPSGPMNEFKPVRSTRNSLLRLSVPMPQ
jgi:hypothetical protein